MKKFAFASVCVLAMVGFVVADEFTATITKVDGNNVTFMKGKKGEQTEGKAEALPTVKVLKGMFDPDTKALKAGDPIEKGLKNEMFTSIGDKGVKATITTDDKGKISQIVVGGGKGKKGGQ